MSDLDQSGGRLRWYEFEQREVLVRPFWVRARSLKEAQRMVRESKSGLDIGVPDYAPDGADDIAIVGRGRLADQEVAQDMADEREWDDASLWGPSV
jgi:hypothetical protein